MTDAIALEWKKGGALGSNRSRSRLSRSAVARGFWLFALALAAWAGAAPAPVRSEELPPAADEALQKGLVAMGQRQWFVAEQQLKIAAEKAADAPEVLLALAQFNEARGGRDLLASYWYRAYIAARPDDPQRAQITTKIEAFERNAMTTARGLINNALAAANSIATNDRSSPLSQIAVAQAKLGDLPAALATASSAVSLNQFNDAYGGLASALAAKGNLAGTDEALRHVDQRLRGGALRGVVNTLANAKRPSDALAYAAPTTGGDRVYAYSSIATAYAQAGDKRAAHANLDIAIQATSGADQFQRPYLLLNLAETSADLGEIDTAKQLYAEAVKLIPPANMVNNASNLFSTRSRMVNGITQAGRFAEAEALVATLIPDPKINNLGWYRANAQENLEKARQTEATNFIKDGKLAEIEAQLAHEPWSGAYALARIELAKAYGQKKDVAGQRRNIEAAAAGLAKAPLQEGANSFTFALNRLAVVDALLGLDDLAAARRVLDATIAVINKITKADQKEYPIEYLAQGYTRLAAAEAKSQNFGAAKSAALEVFALANQMNSGGSRASALANISGLDARVGITNDLMAVLDAMPADYNKQTMAANLVKQIAALGHDAGVPAVAAKIADPASRKSALSAVIASRIAAGNWAAATALANDPDVSGRLNAEIARKMVDAGMVREAATLESKFGAPSSESNSYFSALQTYRTRNAEYDAAAQAALRYTAVGNQISNLFSIASSAFGVGGTTAARPLIERAFNRFGDLKSPLERENACQSIAYYFQLGSVLGESLPKADGQTDGASVGQACVAEALNIPAQNDRLSPLSSLISSSSYLVTQPIMAQRLAPTRAAVSRLFAEASGLNSSSRDSQIASATNGLARDGAIEAALDLAWFPTDARSYNTAYAAVQWLMEAGDTATAERIANQLLDHVATLTNPSAKDSASLSAVNVLITIGDLERALKAAADIVAPGNRNSPLVSIANAANARGRFDVALNALERARLADKEAGRSYYLSSYVGIASQAGDKRPEALIDEVEAQKGQYAATNAINARDTVIRGHLKWKQRDRALALVPVQEAAIERLDASSRWSYAGSFANILAQLGDGPRLDKLIGEASPANQVALLQQAARGYLDAEKADSARAALDRSVQLIGALTLPADKLTNFQAAAALYVRQNEPDVAAKLLAQSLEAVHITRPDLAAWTNYMIAINQEPYDPEQSERRAAAIADPRWQARALAYLAAARLGKDRTASGLALIRSAPASDILDPTLLRFVRSFAGKGEIDTARTLIGRISHPGLRDEARRQLVLITGRRGQTEASLAETSSIENPATRAYAMIDLAAFLAHHNAGRLDLYFAQLACFVAAKLADQVSDPLVKADLLADVARGLEAMEPEAAAPALERARSVAAAVPAGRPRDYAMAWASGQLAMARPTQALSDEASQWRYSAGYLANDQKYTDLEGFVGSLAAKNPSDRVYGFVNAASDFAAQIEQAHAKEKELADKRRLAHL